MVVNNEMDESKLLISTAAGKKDAKEYFALNVEQVFVGVENPERQEIVKNPVTGLNYQRNAVEGQEVYNRKKHAKRNWFMLDLETGSRGWFPGCEIHGQILEDNVQVKAEPRADAATLYELSGGFEVNILNMDTPNDNEPFSSGWYEIDWRSESGHVGYVQYGNITNIQYSNPF